MESIAYKGHAADKSSPTLSSDCGRVICMKLYRATKSTDIVTPASRKNLQHTKLREVIFNEKICNSQRNFESEKGTTNQLHIENVTT